MRLIYFLVCLGLLCCNEIEDCALNPYSDALSITFKSLNSNTTIRFDSVVVQNIGKIDSIDDSLVLTKLLVPLSPRDTSLHINFFTDSAVYYLQMGYQVQSLIYELDCEVAIRYHSLMVRDQNITEVMLLATEIDNRFFIDHVALSF